MAHKTVLRSENMLFWIFVALLILGIVLGVIADKNWLDGMMLVAITLTAIGVVCVLCSVCVMVWANVEADANVEKCQARYESLVYQYENNLYDNDNDVGKRELMADIERWNSDLSYRKAMQDNFWVGIYFPNIYDEFEYIELKSQ